MFSISLSSFPQHLAKYLVLVQEVMDNWDMEIQRFVFPFECYQFYISAFSIKLFKSQSF